MSGRNLSTVNPPTLAAVVAERDRLRAVISEALTDLDCEHLPEGNPGKEPWGCAICCGSWPCVSKMVADELRAAIEGGA